MAGADGGAGLGPSESIMQESAMESTKSPANIVAASDNQF